MRTLLMLRTLKSTSGTNQPKYEIIIFHHASPQRVTTKPCQGDFHYDKGCCRSFLSVTYCFDTVKDKVAPPPLKTSFLGREFLFPSSQFRTSCSAWDWELETAAPGDSFPHLNQLNHPSVQFNSGGEGRF